MSRYNRYDDYYDNWDGDWGWFDANIDEDREQFVHIPLPETCDDWYLTAFSVSKVSNWAFIVNSFAKTNLNLCRNMALLSLMNLFHMELADQCGSIVRPQR